MLGTHDLPLFILSGLLLNITPGADSLYIASRSIANGVRAGVAAALGISAGCYVHIVAAALGFSAILATSSAAFILVKLVGAAYLVYLGVSLFCSKPAPLESLACIPTSPLRTIFVQGFLTSVLNPKVALFFLAFVPQFIEPSAPNKALAFLFLGAIFSVSGTLWCLFLAWAASRLRSLRLGVGSRAVAWLNRGVGSIFILVGVRLAFTEQA